MFLQGLHLIGLETFSGEGNLLNRKYGISGHLGGRKALINIRYFWEIDPY